MKKFKFKLDGLLKVREFREKALKVELGEILKEITRIKDAIAVIESSITEAYNSQEAFSKDPTSGQMMQFFPAYIKGRKKDIDAKEQLIYALERKFEEKQKELASARGDVKVIENLKDKKKTEFKKKIDKKHQEMVDEIMMIKRSQEAINEG